MTNPTPRLNPPVSTPEVRYSGLGYLEAFDVPLQLTYAFVAYREDRRDTGDWRIRIRSSQTAGAEFDPPAIARQARSSAARGCSHFLWGYSFEPSTSDPRQIEFRVHLAKGRPAEVELYVRLRQADGTAGPAQTLRFPWPTD